MADRTPVPAVTRDQVWQVIHRVLAGDMRPGTDDATSYSYDDIGLMVAEITEALYGERLLFEAPQPKVLNVVETRPFDDDRPTSSLVLALVKVPPGTPVVVALGPPVPEGPG